MCWKDDFEDMTPFLFFISTHPTLQTSDLLLTNTPREVCALSLLTRINFKVLVQFFEVSKLPPTTAVLIAERALMSPQNV